MRGQGQGQGQKRRRPIDPRDLRPSTCDLQTCDLQTLDLQTRDMLRGWRLWLGVAVSLAFVALALRGQDLGQVRRALGEADYRALPLALALYFAGVWARALRWRRLLAPVRALTARALYPVVVIGYMTNNVLPWRLG